MDIEIDNELFMSVFKPAYDHLNSMSIYEVRNVARAYGFGAPTTERKDVLIRNIISIASGFLQPKPRSNRGPHVKAETPSDQSIAQIQKIVDECKMNMPYVNKMEEPEKITFNDSGASKREYGYNDELFIGVLENSANGKWCLCPENTDTYEENPYISGEFIKQYNLREGDLISGYIERYEDRNSEIACVAAREGMLPMYSERKLFENFAALYPNQKFALNESDIPTVRAMDVLCPIGKGQRVAIIAPNESGKTTLIHNIAKCLEKQAEVIVLLLGQRPEESEEIRSVNQDVMVFSAPFDSRFEQRMRLTHLAFERAKRLAEEKKDVALLIDSFNELVDVDLHSDRLQEALYLSKRIFASARRLDCGGSLTVFATVPSDQDSIVEDAYNDFVRAANSVIYLSKSVAQQGVFPAFDFSKSFTKRDAVLLTDEEQAKAKVLREKLRSNGISGVIEWMNREAE